LCSGQRCRFDEETKDRVREKESERVLTFVPERNINLRATCLCSFKHVGRRGETETFESINTQMDRQTGRKEMRLTQIKIQPLFSVRSLPPPL